MAYAVTLIRPVSGEWGEYERSPDSLDEIFEDEYDAEGVLRESVADVGFREIYEIGTDELPDGVEDIGGLINGGDPRRLYAVSKPDGLVQYFAVDMV